MIPKKREQFQKTVWDFYTTHQRDLPWRPSKKRKVSPYKILVSEYMLQQTQVDRVIPKFINFIKKFPTLEHLAQATDREVLALWSGLGYNRRALYLKKTASILVSDYSSKIPKNPLLLKTFPGIGDYMAHVLPVFIYDQKEVLIETNIRTVFIYHFFSTSDSVSDTEIIELITQTLPEKDFRNWYYALMDYGSYLKKDLKVNNKKSSSYVKQKPFKGSLRFVRGTILKKVLIQKIEKKKIYALFPEYSDIQVDSVCFALVKEGMLHEDKKYYFL